VPLQPAPVDVIGGLRYTKIDVSGNIGASLFGPVAGGAALTVSGSGNKDCPYIGVRVLYPIAERWTLLGYADVGGFGVGSKSTWRAIAGANYDYSKCVSLKFDYRYLSVNYDKDGILQAARANDLRHGDAGSVRPRRHPFLICRPPRPAESGRQFSYVRDIQ
jgi:opacity protein-like surface antigen